MLKVISYSPQEIFLTVSTTGRTEFWRVADNGVPVKVQRGERLEGDYTPDNEPV